MFRNVTTALAALLIAVAPTAHAQFSRPQFEVVSVKASVPGRATVDSGGFGFVYARNGLTGKNVSVKDMIEAAYHLQDFQISGGPDWIDSSMMATDNRFNIEAKSADVATRDQINQMLRSLLTDRFKLSLHRETRDMPTYDLVLAKSGAKLKRVEGKQFSNLRIRGGGGHMNFESASITELIEWLSGAAGHRMIAYKTGLNGRFDFTLDYTPEIFRGGKAPEQSAERQIDPNGISIFTAVQEQLGLKLESSKGPVEVLVVDSVSKPTEN